MGSMIRSADRAAFQGALMGRLGTVTPLDKASRLLAIDRAAMDTQIARYARYALSFCTLLFNLLPLRWAEVSEQHGVPFADSNTTKVTPLLTSAFVFSASVCRNS